MKDLIIIGAGPGGYRAAEYAAKNGLNVTIVERADAGGTCLNCGCIPTKTLCHEAEVLRLTGGEADWSAIMQRKNEVVGQLRSGVEMLMSMPGITFKRGEAKLVKQDGVCVEVGSELLKADAIIIATGSKPKPLPIPGMDLPGVLDSTAVLELQEKPESLAIIGAGVIGMEIASVMNIFGVKVSVVEFLKECLPMLDNDIAKRLRQSISKRGVEFFMQSACKEIRKTDDGQLEVVFTNKKGAEETVKAEKVLVATGRMPATDGLGLEDVGMETNRGAIVVDEHFQTNIPGVYAIGDVNARCMLAHAATMQGIDVVKHLLGQPCNICHEIMPSAIFTLPEAACVSNSQYANNNPQLEGCTVKKAMYRANGKALAMNETEGLLKITADENGRIVACHCYGAHAADMVQEVSALMTKSITLAELADIIHIHPTLGEMVWDCAL